MRLLIDILIISVLVVVVLLIYNDSRKDKSCGWSAYKKNPNNVLERKKYKIIVSLTTSPSRINLMEQTIKDISNQSYPPDKIVLNIPQRFSRTNEEYVIPDWFKNYPLLYVNRIDKDFGPITKLYPTINLLDKNEDTWILVIDDDQRYLPITIENYTKYIDKDSNSAYSIAGFKLSTATKNGFDKCMEFFPDLEPIDVMEGFCSYITHRKFYDVDLDSYLDLCLKNKDCFASDDLIVSNYISSKDVQKKIIFNNDINRKKWKSSGCSLSYGYGKDALHAKGNDDKYKNTIKYLKENNIYFFHKTTPL